MLALLTASLKLVAILRLEIGLTVLVVPNGTIVFAWEFHTKKHQVTTLYLLVTVVIM
jgi:hypothetical protein